MLGCQIGFVFECNEKLEQMKKNHDGIKFG